MSGSQYCVTHLGKSGLGLGTDSAATGVEGGRPPGLQTPSDLVALLSAYSVVQEQKDPATKTTAQNLPMPVLIAGSLSGHRYRSIRDALVASLLVGFQPSNGL